MKILLLKITVAALVALGAAFLVLPRAAESPLETPREPDTTALATATPRADAPTPTATARVEPRAAEMPVYASFDFLSNYLTNRTHPIIVEGKPWISSSLNLAQWRAEARGTTFWDFWGEEEQWETTNHQWQDDAGEWHLYTRETITAKDGKRVAAYLLVDRAGPGVLDALVFTQDTIIWRGDILQHLKILGTKGIEETVEWGGLQKLGNLRIEVDDAIVFDGGIRDWFSGKAQGLTPALAKILVWRYQDFGSSGNIIPIPYQSRLRVWLYGGEAKPKWFMATGVTFPRETRVQPFRANALPIAEMDALAQNVWLPEKYIDAFETQTHDLRAQADAPARIELNGAGTVEALQFSIAKKDDAKKLWLRVRYDDATGIDLPFHAFFTDHDTLALHRSTPIGVIDAGDVFLFYSNLPMPYPRGMTIEVASATPIAISARLAVSNETHTTRLYAHYRANERLRALAPDYRVEIEGSGKLVGIVLATKEQDMRGVVKRNLPNSTDPDPATHAWQLGYLESNLHLQDGAGNARIFSGHEDWALGGYYFNLGFTTPSGGGNRTFGGLLRFKEADDGYATVYRYFNDLSAFRFKNGLTLSFGHGTWRNNYPVTFGTSVIYYAER